MVVTSEALLIPNTANISVAAFRIASSAEHTVPFQTLSAWLLALVKRGVSLTMRCLR